TVKQLQTLAKQNGVSIARTKADFIKLLDQAEPGFDHTNLTGAALKAKLKEHKIGLLRTKDELAKLVAKKQRALQKAQEISERLKKGEGLQLLTTDELKEMARSKGVSIYMTKQDVIDLLDRLEPGLDHSELSGQSLIEARRRHHIGVLKSKQQLIKSIEKVVRKEVAETVKREALKLLKQ
ncbi:MAG: phage head morphogenesis protein, partial [Deltaproteobacteria bacterium]|nr:phage head morphogenesis protein [Deltaproteobacteria bacterium]